MRATPRKLRPNRTASSWRTHPRASVGSASNSSASSTQNRRNQNNRPRVELTIDWLLVTFYLLLIFEGVLRKWIFPFAQQPLIFIREPVLGFIYTVYVLHLRRTPVWLIVWMTASSAFFLFGVTQVAAGILPPVVLPIGLRNYLMYIPLAFIIAERCDTIAIRHIFRIALIIALPIAALVVIQFKLPPDSILNKGTADGAKGIILVGDNTVRPYGPFTFAQAQNTYAVFMLAVCLIAWEKRRAMGIPTPLLSAAIFSTFAMGALSGGRTFFGGAILVAASYLLSALTTRSSTSSFKRLGLLLGLTLAFLAVFIVVFPDSFALMSSRQQRAVHTEGSTAARGVSMMTLAVEAMQDAPALGHGMGMGSNLGAALANHGQNAPVWTLGEYDWPRIIQELGPTVGMIYISFRVLFFCYIGFIAIARNFRTGDNSSMIMFGFAGYLILAAQVIGQSQLLSFCWFTCGLTLALAHRSGRAAKDQRLSKAIIPRTAHGQVRHAS